MRKYCDRRTAVIAAVGGALAVFFASGRAKAVTDTVFAYSTPQNGFVSLHAMAFAPDSNISAGNYFNDWTSGITTQSGGCFNAGVNLPDGAKLKTLTIYGENTTGYITFSFLKQNLSNGNPVTVASASFSDTSGTRQAQSFGLKNATVSNQLGTYGLGICLGNSGDTFYGARISFTYTDAGY